MRSEEAMWREMCAAVAAWRPVRPSWWRGPVTTADIMAPLDARLLAILRSAEGGD